MQNLIAFQYNTTATFANPLPSHSVKNGITLVNNTNSDDTILFGNNPNVQLTVLREYESVWVPLPGGNTDQIWIRSSISLTQVISVIGT
jgi:hypothetical protein